MSKTLEAFRMSKSQMNRIGGGEVNFHCTFDDTGTPGWTGQPIGEIDLHGFKDGTKAEEAEAYLGEQLGPVFYIDCDEI